MAQRIPQTDSHVETQQTINQSTIDQIAAKHKTKFMIVTTIALLVSAFSIFYIFSTIGLVRDGIFYREHIMSKQMLPFWKQLGQQEETGNQTALIEEGQHKITRQQLGRMGWTLLHMMTGSFPKTFTPELRDKWNTFLLLFGHFYPCKLCSSHFLKMQKQMQPFNGTEKKELMIYLCNMHNKVNQRLKKPIHDCQNVKDEWNTCGCREG